MTEVQSPPTGGTKRWVRVLLIASLALNFLIIGTVGGAMLTWSKWQSHHPPRLDLASGPLTKALSREERRAIGKEMRQTYKSGDLPRANLRREMRDLVADIRKEPFDPSVVNARLERLRTVIDARYDLGHSLLVTHLTQMTPEARSAYADRLSDVLKRHNSGRDKRKDKDAAQESETEESQ